MSRLGGGRILGAVGLDRRVFNRSVLAQFDLGLGTEPRHVEGMRSKLKRLVERGILTEPSSGLLKVDGRKLER